MKNLLRAFGVVVFLWGAMPAVKAMNCPDWPYCFGGGVACGGAWVQCLFNGTNNEDAYCVDFCYSGSGSCTGVVNDMSPCNQDIWICSCEFN